MFLIFNVVILIASFFLTLSSIVNYKLILALPTPLIIVYIIGLITPVLNLKDTFINLLNMSKPQWDFG